MTIENYGPAGALKSPSDARQGVTGHNVRYVLGFSLAGAIGAFILVALYYGLYAPI